MSPRHTSTACHGCGHRQPMPLGVRAFICGGCGLVTGRDVNAVHNILQRGSALATCEIGVSYRPGASENVVHFHVVGVLGQDQNGIRRGVSASRHVYHFPSTVDGQGPSVATVFARRVLTHGLMEARLRSLSGGGDARKAPSRPSGVRRAETRCTECSSGIRCHAKRHASGRRSEVVSKGFSHPQGAARGNGRTADGVGPA